MSTSTHYLHNYTDWNDVDEDKRTIIAYGGPWSYGTNAGITYRNIYDSPTTTLGIVASKK